MPQTDADTRQLYFLHIPKTGGTTLREWLASHYRPSEVFVRPDAPDALRCGREGLGRYRLICGHFGLYVLPLLEPGVRVVTLLRDPLSRSVSHYRDIRSRPGHPCYGRVRGWTLEQFVCSRLGEAELLNLQCRFLALAEERDIHEHVRLAAEDPEGLYAKYSDPGMLDRASATLDRVDALGVCERLETLVHDLARGRGWPAPPRVERLNAARSLMAPEEVTPAAVARLRELTRLDQSLYDHAMGRIGSRDARPPSVIVS